LAESDDSDLRLRWTGRLSLTARILAVNVFALAILAGSLLYLDSFASRLTAARSRRRIPKRGSSPIIERGAGIEAALLRKVGAIRARDPDLFATALSGWTAVGGRADLPAAGSHGERSSKRACARQCDRRNRRASPAPCSSRRRKKLTAVARSLRRSDAPDQPVLRRAPTAPPSFPAARRPCEAFVLLLTINDREYGVS
jgi:two-component system sensor histidine kinase ChvG